MNIERKSFARACLDTEDAKKEFDTLCAMHPEAVIFWDEEGRAVELELENVTIQIS